MSLLRVEKLSKRFLPGEPFVLNGITFDVGANEIFVLVGPSGSGKTTTLRLIAGFERTDGGRIDFEGRCIEKPDLHVVPHKRNIGYVVQDYALFPHMTVWQNVCFGLRRQTRRDRTRRALEVLSTVGMSDQAQRTPHELSGGEQQRVALARSMAPAPKLLLLDEPFSNLDAAMRQSMRHEVRRILRRNRMSALMVTHDQEEALSFADRIGVMNRGRVEQTGDPQAVYQRPHNAFVAQFLGRTNLLPASATGKKAQCPLGTVLLHVPTRGRVTISIRPEHLKFENLYPGQPAGQIIHREFKGHDLTYTVAFHDYTLIVHTDFACPFKIGQSVRVVPTEPAVVMAEKT